MHTSMRFALHSKILFDSCALFSPQAARMPRSHDFGWQKHEMARLVDDDEWRFKILTTSYSLYSPTIADRYHKTRAQSYQANEWASNRNLITRIECPRDEKTIERTIFLLVFIFNRIRERCI